MRWLVLLPVLVAITANSAEQNFLVFAKLESVTTLSSGCGNFSFSTGYLIQNMGEEVEIDEPAPSMGCVVDVEEQTYQLIEAVGVSEQLETIKVIHFSNSNTASNDPDDPYFCVEYEKRKEGKFVINIQSASDVHQCKRIEIGENGT